MVEVLEKEKEKTVAIEPWCSRGSRPWLGPVRNQTLTPRAAASAPDPTWQAFWTIFTRSGCTKQSRPRAALVYGSFGPRCGIGLDLGTRGSDWSAFDIEVT